MVSNRDNSRSPGCVLNSNITTLGRGRVGRDMTETSCKQTPAKERGAFVYSVCGHLAENLGVFSACFLVHPQGDGANEESTVSLESGIWVQ